MSVAGPHSQPDDALVDLLIKQVTEGLSPDEQRALDVIDGEVASGYLRDFERAAAALSLAGSASKELPPPWVRTRIEVAAQRFFAPAPRSAAARHGTAGWFAAAACLLLALFGWLRPPSGAAPASVNVPAAPALAAARAALLAHAGALKITLGATEDPAAHGVSGDVVWDPVTQQGFLRFVGLQANDAKLHQYQLWIFDGERDQRYPVDGGVFDIPASASEVLVPIHAALPVRRAKAFAVTIEQPGGAVVSARDHVVVLGKVG